MILRRVHHYFLADTEVDAGFTVVHEGDVVRRHGTLDAWGVERFQRSNGLIDDLCEHLQLRQILHEFEGRFCISISVGQSTRCDRQRSGLDFVFESLDTVVALSEMKRQTANGKRGNAGSSEALVRDKSIPGVIRSQIVLIFFFQEAGDADMSIRSVTKWQNKVRYNKKQLWEDEKKIVGTDKRSCTTRLEI